MPRENAASKSVRYLGEHRLTVTRVDTDRIDAVCRGDGRLYALGWDPGRRWYCDCPATSDRCCHLLALRSVTVRARQL